METLESANTYYNAARNREKNNPDEAKKLYAKAADIYAEIRKNYPKNIDKDFIDGRIDSCIDRLDSFVVKNKEERISEGNEKSPVIEFTTPKTTFESVAGMYGLKQTLTEAIIEPLLDPGINDYVDDFSRGVILYGPPGCGKSFIAKAVAGQANKESGQDVSYLFITSADILSSWVGESEKAAKELFKKAAEKAPSVIVIDEVDGLCTSRGGNKSVYSRRLVNQLLSSFDALEDANVLVVGTTNFPWQIDSAFLRPGRFDTCVYVSPPDLEARVELFRLYTQKKKIIKQIDFETLAKETEGYSCADIRKICNEAGRLAWRDSKNNGGKRPIQYLDMLEIIKNSDKTIYHWCENDVAPQLKKNKIPAKFGALESLVKEVESKQNGNWDNPPGYSPNSSEEGGGDEDG